jgi:hypothetical protein
MAENENTVAAEEPAIIEEEQATHEIDAESIMNQLTSDEPPAQEEQEEEEPEQEDEDPGAAIKSGIIALFEDGWTQEELEAFSNDPQARADIKAGKDVIRAAMAYTRRAKAAAKPAKKGVPTFRNAATAGAKETNKIETMSDEEFARFSDRMYEEAMSGKRIRF